MGLYAAQGRRLSYDIDGTTIWLINQAGTSFTQYTGTNLNLDGTGAALTVPANTYLAFLFPAIGNAYRPTYVDTVSVWGPSTNSFVASWSQNSTTGFDGTWTSGTTGAVSPFGSSPDVNLYTNNANWSAFGGVSSIRGVRLFFSSSTQVDIVHIWGAVQGYTNLPYLVLGNTDGSGREFNVVDMGDVTRGLTTTITTGRTLWNSSTSLTANNVVLSWECNTAPSPSGLSEHQVQYNGGSWGTSATITSIAPNSPSASFNARRVTSSTAATGPWVYRLRWTVGSWT